MQSRETMSRRRKVKNSVLPGPRFGSRSNALFPRIGQAKKFSSCLIVRESCMASLFGRIGKDFCNVKILLNEIHSRVWSHGVVHQRRTSNWIDWWRRRRAPCRHCPIKKRRWRRGKKKQWVESFESHKVTKSYTSILSTTLRSLAMRFLVFQASPLQLMTVTTLFAPQNSGCQTRKLKNCSLTLNWLTIFVGRCHQSLKFPATPFIPTMQLWIRCESINQSKIFHS